MSELQCITCRHLRAPGARRSKNWCDGKRGRPVITDTMPGQTPCPVHESRHSTPEAPVSTTNTGESAE